MGADDSLMEAVYCCDTDEKKFGKSIYFSGKLTEIFKTHVNFNQNVDPNFKFFRQLIA